ncbi:TPA: hypothetical protein IXN57_000421 [Enterococcus faecium]|uniref:hypothetical protein n=1 Tax=Enterococcus faecium TaxID=1352 RepID=UPI00032EB3FA|nr:hypothetical protein [Enterococcus faecium]EOH45632.1 hypothetical protein SSI_01672 [Enterococcus faecium EnGen0191]HAQ3640931.1 hypothetical protein [Enterococcus faecium]HCU0013964.1 hypothetical protein [Enterococcus faecium]
MIFLLLLLCGITMVGCGVWLMVSIKDAKTLLDCYFSVLTGFFGLEFGMLLIIASLMTL